MTPQERAEKIVDFGQKLSDEKGSSRRMIDWLAAQISEAEKEARDSVGSVAIYNKYRTVDEIKKAYEEGWNSAIEKAAEVANLHMHDVMDKYMCLCGFSIRDEIRSLRKEDKK